MKSIDKGTRFDDALPRMADLIARFLGAEALECNCILRDAEGNLTLVLRDTFPAETVSQLEQALKNSLHTYAAQPPVCTPDDLLDSSLADPSRDRWELITTETGPLFARIVERRLVGQDWLRGIAPRIPGTPPIVVFSSHKGGVGRSTALAVASAEFAARGKSILAIDLDLEAPGLGGMFMPKHEIPEFGAIDYYVENGRGGVDSGFIRNMVSVSPLTQGRGQVLVVPATGRRCHEHPQNMIGKLSRAYLEDLDTQEGTPKTFLDQTRILISELCQYHPVDAVFVDARAGLNETTAATIQGLAADVLLFGIDTPQTWDGYRYFLSHLARFKHLATDDDWRLKIKMVHAKAALSPRAWSHYRDKAFDLFAEHLYDEVHEELSYDTVPFGFDINDADAPHHAWPILVDSTYFEFDPLQNQDQFEKEIYDRTFGLFLGKLAERLEFQ